MPARRRFRKKAQRTRDARREFSVDAWLKARCTGTYCKTPDAPVTLAPDPYAWEIHGDDTPVLLCADCRHERSMEI
jgi:hypothetical protein